ncbi:MAG TPA: RHS repeat-associated core domain-containing protein [Rhizomicrobium sp.]|jgi:hypothetical protein|nr:RHS repeat-associated core domain-containing protein [Rhizomicrobium sp.]
MKSRNLLLCAAATATVFLASSAQARFLQADPAGYADDMNMYTYVQDDPTDKMDPDGRTVVLATPQEREICNKTVGYMSKSSTFTKEFRQLQASQKTYEVKVDRNTNDTHYDDKNRTITYNPTDALRLPNRSLQSPAMGFGHEVDHANRDDENHEQFKKDTAAPTEGETKFINGVETAIVNFSDSPDELKAMSVEGKMARELGEPQRSNHSEGMHEKVDDPTKHCTGTSTNHCY